MVPCYHSGLWSNITFFSFVWIIFFKNILLHSIINKFISLVFITLLAFKMLLLTCLFIDCLAPKRLVFASFVYNCLSRVLENVWQKQVRSVIFTNVIIKSIIFSFETQFQQQQQKLCVLEKLYNVSKLRLFFCLLRTIITTSQQFISIT